MIHDSLVTLNIFDIDNKILNKSTFDTIMQYYELNEKSNYSIETYYNCKDYINNSETLLHLFKSYNFPLSVSGITIDRVIEVSKNDKKMDGGKIKFILLSEMGNAYIDRDVTDNDMAEALVGIID